MDNPNRQFHVRYALSGTRVRGGLGELVAHGGAFLCCFGFFLDASESFVDSPKTDEDRTPTVNLKHEGRNGVDLSDPSPLVILLRAARAVLRV